MAEKWKRPPLADAPFYAVLDERTERNSLVRFGPVVTDPKSGRLKKASGRPPMTEEELAYARAEKQRLRELDPSAQNYEFLFDRREFPMEPYLMEKTRRVFGAKPKTIAHWDRILAMLDGSIWYRFYTFVSEQWKGAIESVEPGVHEFFPLALEFVQPQVVSTHSGFVMRDRVFVIDHRPTSFRFSHYPAEPAVWDRHNKPITLVFSKQAVAGRHWFQAHAHHIADALGPFVSRELVERLLPMMPDKVHLVPVAVR